MQYPTKLKVFYNSTYPKLEQEFNKWAADKYIQNFQMTQSSGCVYIAVLYSDGPNLEYLPVRDIGGPFGPVGPLTPPTKNPYEITCQGDPTNGEFVFH